MNAPDGHKYLRSYQTKTGVRWALYQVIHGRAIRVGTAETIAQWQAFLGISDGWRYGMHRPAAERHWGPPTPLTDAERGVLDARENA
jgi:hypothetical protein